MWSSILCVLCLSTVATSNDQPVKVHAPAGTFIGRTRMISPGKQYHAFRGIPYAQPPVGELRFKKPIAVSKLPGEYDAVSEKPFCLQMNMLPNKFGDGEEDCLYLNVFTPQINGDSLLPVFVFIHGGGHTSGMKDFYLPGSLVADNDIITVTINYRLGLLGFLTTQTSTSPGNFGLWDQVEALRWVQANIEAFGGDPRQVTVGGESAGGIDTTALSLCSQSRGLFSRVFPMSGAIGVQHPSVMASDPVPVTVMFARREKCIGDGDPDPQNANEWDSVMECLRKVPEKKFASTEELGALPFIGPVIDGDYFPKSIEELFADQAYLESIGFHDRDYLVSLVNNEGDLFRAWQDQVKSTMTTEQLEALPPNAMWHGFIGPLLTNLYGTISQEVISRVAQWYEENYEINALADFGSDVIFHVPGYEYLNSATKFWQQEQSRLYFLRFVHFPDFSAGPYKGMLHAVDLAYVFDIEIEDINKVIDYKIDGSKWKSSEDELKKEYSSLVSSFVKTGKPSLSSGLEWPAYTGERGHYLEFGPSPTVRQHLKSDRVKLFHQQIPAWIQEFPYSTAEESTGQHTEL